jgi:predicted nucleotide-binding protein
MKKNKREESPGNGDQRGKIKSDFPKHTLENALRVAVGLAEKNGGQPLPPTDTAIALGVSPGSSDFRVLLSSSIKYGLTTGSYNQERVSLTDLGRSIVEPKDEEEKRVALIKAALTPPTFQAIYSYLRGKKLPDTLFFKNTVMREFQVPKEHAETCVNIFVDSVTHVGLVREATTGRWLSSQADPVALQSEATPSTEEILDDVSENHTALPEIEKPAVEPKAERKANSAIFIGHGKNKAPLEQLEKLLNQFKIPYKVAIEEANSFRPISQKVAETMKECGAAILLFTADTEYKDANGDSVWKPSENVVYELGAASVLYGDRIVIFKETSVNFPANFRDIGHIGFEKDHLSAKINELFKELIAFGLIKITVGG